MEALAIGLLLFITANLVHVEVRQWLQAKDIQDLKKMVKKIRRVK